MAFTVEDFADLQRLLAAHPEWRAQLRPLILGDEFLQVPERLIRIDERLDRISETLDRMAAAQAEFDRRLAGFQGRLGNMDGKLLELKYSDNLGNWFRQTMRRARRVLIEELDLLSEAVKTGRVSESEVSRLDDVDMIVGGSTQANGQDEMLFTVEISTTINVDDVDRAEAAAATLRKAGYRAVGFVGGHRASRDATTRSAELNVILDLRRLSN
jgi:hypothetical protein